MKWTDIDLKNKTAGTHKFICPECSPTRKNKRDLCLSVDIDRGVYNCHHCGAKGGRSEFKPKVKEPPIMPKLNTTELSEKMFAYFQSRHISTTTIKRNQIGEGMRWMPQENGEINCIWFNYFKDKQYVNTKFRSAKKQFTQVKNAPKHFYKIDDVKDEAIITEGEFDALSWEEAGFNYAISVPDGALPPNSNYSETKFEYIDNDIDVLLGVKKIYLSIDNDPAGQHLQKELSRRVGREKCLIIDLGQFKDANEVLTTLGKAEGIEWLRMAKNEAKPYPIEGMQTVAEHEADVIDLYDNGFDIGKGLGYPEFDQKMRWLFGFTYLFTGIPSHGKSSFVDQVLVRLMQRADWKIAIYSPEHPQKFHLQRLTRILLEMPFSGQSKMSKEELKDALAWLNERMFFIEPDNDDFSLENILEITKQLVSQKGVNCLLLDPWNTIDHLVPTGMSEGQYISKSLTKIKLFNKRYDISTIIVAHPTKMQKNEDGSYKVPTGYNVADSAHFYNKPDMGLTVYRNFDSGLVDVHIWKVKFEGILGEQGIVQFTHDKQTARYKQLNEQIEFYEKETTQPNKIARPDESDFEDFKDIPF